MKMIEFPKNLIISSFYFYISNLSEPALDVAEAGVGVAPLGLAGLLGGVWGEIEPGEPHPPPEKRPPLRPLHLHINICNEQLTAYIFTRDGPFLLRGNQVWRTLVSDPLSSH